jgi:small redox-active disulfide protein 2
MRIRILGTGCRNCISLEANVNKAVEELGLDADIEMIKEVADIMSYGLMSTPGLVVGDQVKVAGRVPSTAEIKSILES